MDRHCERRRREDGSTRTWTEWQGGNVTYKWQLCQNDNNVRINKNRPLKSGAKNIY